MKVIVMTGRTVHQKEGERFKNYPAGELIDLPKEDADRLAALGFVRFPEAPLKEDAKEAKK